MAPKFIYLLSAHAIVSEQSLGIATTSLMQLKAVHTSYTSHTKQTNATNIMRQSVPVSLHYV